MSREYTPRFRVSFLGRAVIAEEIGVRIHLGKLPHNAL